MRTYIALLRAVNVGGTGKLSMAELRQALAGAGFRGVQTYIQSGNVVFQADADRETASATVRAELRKLLGKEPGVLFRTHAELAKIVERNPYAAHAAEDGSKVHAVFLESAAREDAPDLLQQIVQRYPNRRDSFALDGDTLYLHLPDGAADTRFTGKALERALGVSTARNWNTVLKLLAMAAPE